MTLEKFNYCEIWRLFPFKSQHCGSNMTEFGILGGDAGKIAWDDFEMFLYYVKNNSSSMIGRIGMQNLFSFTYFKLG